MFPGGAVPVSALDPAMYSVALAGDAKGITGENITRYTISSSDESFMLPGTAFQRIARERSRGSKKILFIEAGAVNGGERPPSKSDLQDTRFLELESPEIRATAARFASSSDPVGDIERFVHGHITRKAAGIPLAPATAILKGRAGDCTEHSVLSLALLRARGIPARAMVGMVFSEEYEGLRSVFVYHMWGVAHVGGKWVMVDATRPGPKQSNLYIAFASHSLKTEAPLSYLKAISAIRDLTVKRGWK
jgi:transglutaminase-like putative cysteine protease